MPVRSHPIARVREGRALTLYSRPGGPRISTVASRTPFGSARAFAVVRRRGRWLGVLSEARRDGKPAWIRHDAARLTLSKTRWSLRVVLSRRLLELRSGNRVVLRLRTGIGGPTSPTPTGLFAVTDKLPGNRFSPYYGCCILALSGHQRNPPAGWTGGSRLAIHGTPEPSRVGSASSAGCLRTSNRGMRTLMRRVPPGAPVRVVARPSRR